MSEADHLRQKIDRLRARLRDERDEDVREALETQLERCLGQLAALTHPAPAPTSDRAPGSGQQELHDDSRVYGANVLTNLGHIWINQTFMQPTSSGKTTERLLDEYVVQVQFNANRLVLGTDTQDTDQEQMSLDHVWTMLNAQWLPPSAPSLDLDKLHALGDAQYDHTVLSEKPGGRITMLSPVLQALGEKQHHHAVLLGGTGGGKTTVISYLAAAQAEAIKTPAKRGTLHQQGWYHTALLPVRVRLKQVVPLTDSEHQTYHALWEVVSELNLMGRDFNPSTAKAEDQARLRNAVEELLTEGKGLLLLDGLDEVPLERLAAVKRCITNAQAMFGKSRIIVSCRIRDYENPPPPPYPGRQMIGLPTLRLELFDLAGQQEYVRRYYAELGRNRPSNEDSSTIRAKSATLRAELVKNTTLAELTRTPLLLALMVYVNMEHTKLPDSEGKLLHLCVDELLKRRAPTEAGDHVPLDQLHAMVALIAYHAHGLEEQQGAAFNGLDDAAIEGLIKGYYQAIYSHPGQGRQVGEWTARAKDRLLNSNGLLHESGNNAAAPSYDFPHRLFQQFLAGLYLLDTKFHEECVSLVTQPHWRLSLNLMANYAPYSLHHSTVFSLVQTLLIGSTAQQIRGAELLISMTRLKVRPDLWRHASTAMEALSIAEPQVSTPPSIPTKPTPHERLAAGLALGELGDPRFVQPDGSPSPITKRLVKLTPGKFDLKNDDNELRRITLPQFWIGHLPITNAEYLQFVDAGGYRDDRWWPTSAARRWRDADQDWIAELRGIAKLGYISRGDYQISELIRSRSAPAFWDEQRFNRPTQPLVGINWWEANAFCAWLNVQHHGWLAAVAPGIELKFRLPSDFEWERAARNGDARTYPWGNEWREGYANTEEIGFNQTSPVGLFAQGTWPGGPLDLTGNVWEWTRSVYVPYDIDYDTQRLYTTPDNRMSIRGGSWSRDESYGRCAVRYNDHPFYYGNKLGLRVVVVPSLPALLPRMGEGC